MKKILLFFVAIFSLFITTNKVLAADFGTAISGASEIEAGESFTLTFKITGATNIWSAMGNLNYDSTKLTKVSEAAGSGFNLTLGTRILVDSTSGHSGTFTMCTITFKGTANFKAGETTTVSLSNVSCSNGEADLSGSSSSKTIKVVPPKSTNNYLSSLTLSEGKITFSKTKTSYSITVENDIKSIKIDATAEDTKAKVTGTGTKNLAVYSNTFKVLVTSESGAKRTYTIVVKRKDEEGRTSKEVLSKDNSLKSLAITGYNLTFETDKTEYALEVENDVTDLTITALANDAGATVQVNKPENLIVGENTYTIVVTSKSGEEKTYTLKVTKKDKVAEPVVDIKPKDETKNCDHMAYYIVIGALTVLLIVSAIFNVNLYHKLRK